MSEKSERRPDRDEGPFSTGRHHWADPVDRRAEKERYLDKPSNVRTLLWSFTILGFAFVLVELVFHRHVIHPWEGLFAFYPIFGFVGIFVLVYGARGLRKLVMRPEDYYRDDG